MNNRTLLWIRLVVLILSFVAVLAAAVVAMTGGKFSVSLIGDGKLAAEASFSDVTDIAVEGRTCAVEIVAGTGPDVVARYYTGGLLPAETPVWEQTGGTLRVTTSKGNFLSGGRLVLEVPEDDALNYQLDTISGGIRVYVGGSALTVQCTTGSVKVYKPFQSLDVETTTGSVKVTADGSTTRCRLESTTGSIKLALEDVPGYTLTAESTTSSVKDEYNGLSYERSVSGAVWGDGSLAVEAESTTGSIKLTDW